jgi:hypothetical protein
MPDQSVSESTSYCFRTNIQVPKEDARTAAQVQTAAAARLNDLPGHSGCTAPLPRKGVN